ncbi:MAG: hypothetical protein CMJ90_10600 [Planctomycetes bacterium]|nr:hypothetical protein [Planctomycetota bacterium]
MLSKLLPLVVVAVLANFGVAQDWTDGFEAYPAGYLCYQDPALVPGAPCALGNIGNSGGWDGWFNNPLESGLVINNPGMGSNGSDQYMDISPGIGSQDAVQPFKENALSGAGAASGAPYTSHATSGGWALSADFQIPVGGSALGAVYFIFNNDYNNAGTATNWSGQCSMIADPANPGQYTINDDLDPGPATAGWVEGEWYRIIADICLDANTCDITLYSAGSDGVLGTADDMATVLTTGRVYAAGGPVEIACLDLYSAGGQLFYDNMSLTSQGPWQINNAVSALDLNGGGGSACTGSHLTAAVGTPVTMNSAGAAGNPFDIAVTFANSVPAYITTAGQQQVNVDINHSSLFNLNGGAPNFAGLLRLLPHPGAFSFPVPTAGPILASAQQLVLDATHADAFQLSQAVEVDIQGCGGTGTPFSPALPDDGNVLVTLQSLHPCALDVTFYGTTYTEFYIGSNGDVTFTAGSSDFTATYGEWATMMPRIGFAADLEPNNYGVITASHNGNTGAGDWITISYANVTEWGTTGMGVTSYNIELHGPNGHEIGGFTTDGTWGVTSTCMGMSNGSLGTDPGQASFDAVAGSGLQASVNASDCVVDANVGGMIINSTGFTSIQFPLFDGSAYLVQ